MEHENRRYTDEEVSNVIRHALKHGSRDDAISHEELVDIARSSGISSKQLEEAIEHMETVGALEAAKAEWVRRHRAKFYRHLTSYGIVNGFLLFVNLATSRGYLWVMWPMMGWGIAIAFDFVNTFFVSEQRIERGARRLLEKEKRGRMRWAEDQG